MKNLTTRKIVLGLLVGLVLALGVQGVAEALTLSPSTSPSNYSTLTEGSIITVSNISTSLNNAGVLEEVEITATGGGTATFDPASSWTEVDADTSDTSNGTITIPSSVKITIPDAGEVTVTVSWTSKDATATTADASKTFTFYVVIPPNDVGTDSPSTEFASGTTGVHYAFKGVAEQINTAFAFTPAHAPVFYSVQGSGSLHVGANEPRLRLTNGKLTSGSAPVFLSGHTRTSKITAFVAGITPKTATYIYNDPSNPARFPRLEITNGGDQTGAAGGRLEQYLEVKVIDSANGSVSGVAVDFSSTGSASRFIQVPGTELKEGATSPAETISVITDSSGLARTYFQLGNADDTVTATLIIDVAANLSKRFKQFIITSATTDSKARSIVIESGDGQSANKFDVIEDPLVVTVRNQLGQLMVGAQVQFLARDGGEINPPGSNDPGTEATTTEITGYDGTVSRRVIITDSSGQASVRYSLPGDGGRRTVSASINNGAKSQTFTINGPPSSGGDDSRDRADDAPPATTRGSLSISVSPDTGNTRTVTVTALNPAGTQASGISVILNVNNGATLSRTNGPTPLTSTLTLPGTAGDYILTATTTADYTGDTETITVTLPGTLAITAVGARSGTQQQITVTASGRTIPSGGVVVTLQGVTNPRTVTIQSGSTSVSRIATLPSASSPHTVTATAVGYNDAPPLTIPAPGQQPTTTTTTTTQTGTAGVADSIVIDGDRQRSGTVNQVLRLRARVLDANDNGVSGVRVTFRVLAPGQGRLSQRGNGRATQVETDRSGYATASLTPLGGNLIVEAKAAQVTAPVTFIIDVGGGTGGTADTDATASTPSPQTYNVGDKVPISLEGTLSFTNPRTLSGITYTCVGDGECVVSYGLVTKGQIQAAPAAKTTPPRAYQVGDKIPISLEDTLTFTGKHTVNGTSYTCVGDGECVVSYGLVTKGQIEVTTATATTPHTSEIMPEVLLGADRRPPMVWVDGGKLYALVGAAVHAFAPAVENVMNIAVSGDMLYWTQMTGKNAGTINAMHLDGTGAKELVSIHAVPRGIAVDSVAKRLYWTNSQGWIQSSNLEGTARRNVISGGLEDPLGIRVGNGWLYWTQGDGRLQAVNLTGTQAVRTLATGMQSAEGLAVFENKVYWTQMTGRNAGTINAVNLDGTGAKALVSIQAVPRGIVVDGVAKRLYWTNSQGWIQSSNLEGTARRNVAKGLGSPGGIALSATLEVSAMAATQKDAASPTAAAPNYDVDGSGTVDNADLFLVSLAVGTDNAQYDVNGDGTVNDKDIALVRDNRDNGAAAAPMVFGVKLTAEQVGRLQEQIDLLIVSGDRSPDALKTLVYLQQLIATARPERTQLLANYPNPFNPETWIPYELATDTDVRITIYAANGVVVRTLQLGQQSAGYYTDRERAAYWDGRNASGEQVASGVYFYQLETDTISSLRKMVILK